MNEKRHRLGRLPELALEEVPPSRRVEHQLDKGACFHYVVLQLKHIRDHILQRLRHVDDVHNLFGLVSDGSMTDGRSAFVDIGRPDEIVEQMRREEWPLEYLELFHRYSAAHQTGHIGVLGLICGQVHCYVVPRAAFLGEPI